MLVYPLTCCCLTPQQLEFPSLYLDKTYLEGGQEWSARLPV